MKRLVTLLLIAISIDASAQLPGLNDKTVQDICHYVRTLHEQPENYEKVRKEMGENESWTMMSEFTDGLTPESKANLCRLRDQVEYTGINDVAFQVEQERGTLPQSANSFCNGNDPRYNYSFHEVKILAGKSIETSISGGNEADNSGRKGRQLFLVIPFSPGTIDACIKVNGTSIEAETLSNGTLSFSINDAITCKDIIDITLTNTSGINQSAVVINHNSRRN